MEGCEWKQCDRDIPQFVNYYWYYSDKINFLQTNPEYVIMTKTKKALDEVIELDELNEINELERNW